MDTGKKIAIGAVIAVGLTVLGLFLPDMIKNEDEEKPSVYEEAIVYEDAISNQETFIEEETVIEEENTSEETVASNEEITMEETIAEETTVEQTVIVSETEVQERTETVTHNGYIGNIKSEKIHSPDCKNLPYEKNRVYFDTYEEGVEKGFEPCQNCNPQPK